MQRFIERRQKVKWHPNVRGVAIGGPTKRNSETQLDFFEEALAPTKKRYGREIALVLSLILVIGLLAYPAFAGEPEPMRGTACDTVDQVKQVMADQNYERVNAEAGMNACGNVFVIAIDEGPVDTVVWQNGLYAIHKITVLAYSPDGNPSRLIPMEPLTQYAPFPIQSGLSI